MSQPSGWCYTQASPRKWDISDCQRTSHCAQQPKVSLIHSLLKIISFLKIFIRYIHFILCELFAYKYIHAPHAYMVPADVRRGNISSGTGTRHGNKPQCGSWKLNPGPWRKLQVLLTAEPISPAPCFIHFNICFFSFKMIALFLFIIAFRRSS